MTSTLCALLVLVAAMPQVPAQAGASASERALLSLTNQMRVEHHLPSFAWDPALARAARLHAWRIASERGPLEHQYRGEPDLVARASRAGAQFSLVSENIARNAVSPAALLDAWMHTPPHRAALLNPQLTAIGIGVAEMDDGLLSGVQDFSAAVPVFDRETTEAHVVSLLKHRGAGSVAVTEGARAVCRSGAQSSPGARLVVHRQGAVVEEMPRDLASQLGDLSHASVAVAACDASGPDPGFTASHVALLLY